MPRPESVFRVGWLLDGDSPSGTRFVWTLREALEFVATLHDMPWVGVEEVHPTRGIRKVLDYAPGGLITPTNYETHAERWKPGYSTDFVQELLDQYPGRITPRWRG